MAKRDKLKLYSTYKCSGCIGLIDGFRKSPCIVTSEDPMMTPTQCIFTSFNGGVGGDYSFAKWNAVK